jgi:valyl-tRNA synthetase
VVIEWWDQKQKQLSDDEEVIFEEQQGKLYYIQYIIEGSDDFLTIATRPETILVTRPFVLILMMNDLHI